MAAHLRGVDAAGRGIVFQDSVTNNVPAEEEKKKKLELKNRAGESKSPYVRAHSQNPVAWQVWGDEAIALSKKENRLLFVSIGYSACHCRCLQDRNIG